MALPDAYVLTQKLKLHIRSMSETEIICNCPVCDDKKGHMCIDRIKQVWRCPRCGSSGGLYALVEAACNVTHTKAIEIVRTMDFPEIHESNVKIQRESSKEVPLASMEVRDKVYRTMLSLLDLNLMHQKNLEARGLSLKAIRELNFKSTPGRINYDIPQKLIAYGCSLSGVPGFFEHEGKWAMYCVSKGFFIPFLQNGKIFALQIRSDRVDMKNRYRWFSSKGFYHGACVVGKAHEISFSEGMTKVCLTEGALKADIASYLYYQLTGVKMGFIAIAGASSKNVLTEELKKLRKMGVTEIIEALDMDKLGNKSVKQTPEVKIAYKSTTETIEKNDMICTHATWVYEKGIDDNLLFRLSVKKKRAS